MSDQKTVLYLGTDENWKSQLAAALKAAQPEWNWTVTASIYVPMAEHFDLVVVDVDFLGNLTEWTLEELHRRDYRQLFVVTSGNIGEALDVFVRGSKALHVLGKDDPPEMIVEPIVYTLTTGTVRGVWPILSTSSEPTSSN